MPDGMLFNIEPAGSLKAKAAKKALTKRIARASKVDIQRGCSFCPQNNVVGIKKVKRLEYVTGKKIMVWGQNPGKVENELGQEFLGRSGKLLWRELEAVGIKRSDCDIQNCVRCRTPKIILSDGIEVEVDGEPDKIVIHCCSIYNEEALKRNAGKAKVHLIFGNFAAKALLGKDFKKGEKAKWIERLNAWVYCTYHPAYFLRGAARSKLEQFRATLKSAKECVDGVSTSRFSFVESQDYKEVASAKSLRTLFGELKLAARAGVRITVDVENGHNKKSKEVMVCAGFCYKPGKARVVFYDHPEVDESNKPTVKKFFQAVISDPEIKKALHYGCTDEKKFRQLLGIRMRGFDFDTNYGEYIAYSSRYAYGLAAIAESRFPSFAGYKDMIQPYYEDKKTKIWNPYNVPKKVLIVYNGADCDLTKRIELTTKKKVDYSLMQVFIHAGAVLDGMHSRGPIFDAKHFTFLESWIPKRLNTIDHRLEKLSGVDGFNANSPKQVYEFLYDRLKLQRFLPEEWLKQHDGKLDTSKETMEILEKCHKAPGLVSERRRLGKKESTYMNGYKRSAELYGGRVRTRWWITGTATGRLSSGGSKKGDEEETGLVNLQNIDGDPAIECMLVSDLSWRALYADWLGGMSIGRLLKKYGDTDVFLGFDHSQLEMRILAQMSGDPLLIQASLSKYDLHSAVGHLLTGIPVEKIKKDRAIRTVIKGLHFGIVDGLVPENLYLHILSDAKTLGIAPPSKDEVYRWHKKYFERFKMVKPFMDAMVQSAEQTGYVETLFHFKREISPYDNDRSSFWKNQSMNTPIQGTAHQLMLIAMAALRLNHKAFDQLLRLCMEIHDALYAFVKLVNLPTAFRQGVNLLTDETLSRIKIWWPEVNWRIGLQVEGKAGYRLGVMKDYEGGDVAEFLQGWCEKNKKFNAELEEQVRKDLAA